MASGRSKTNRQNPELPHRTSLLTLVKPLPVPCTGTQPAIFQFLPFPLHFCVTALTKGLLGSCLQPHYTLNSEHEGGKEIFLVNAGSICEKNILYRKLNSSLAVLCGLKWH